jgi:hypothetical protein
LFKLGMKKSSIDGNRYLVYLWELGELPVYIYWWCWRFAAPDASLNVRSVHSENQGFFTLQRPPHRQNHRSVGCCVDPLSSGHPRPVLRPSLNILMGAISAPQTWEPAAVGANLGTVRLQWAQGELQHRDLGPWRMTPWKYGAKLLGVVRLLILCEFLVWREKRIVMAGEKL